MDSRIGHKATLIFCVVAVLFYAIAITNGDSPNDTFVLVTANVTVALAALTYVLTRLIEIAVDYIASTVRAQVVHATDTDTPDK